MFFKYIQLVAFIMHTATGFTGAMDSESSIKRADVDEPSSVNMARDLPVKELLDLVSRGFSQHLYLFVLITKSRL
jgi:hypothetical protein